MKMIVSVSLFFLVFIVPAFATTGQSMRDGVLEAKTDSTLTNPAYDAALSERLGAAA